MKKPVLTVAFGLTLLLQGCSTPAKSTNQLSYLIQKQQVVTTTADTYPAKNPQTVAIYTEEQKPLTPYRIIGHATVGHQNLIGNQRDKATVDKMMKTLAASIGGDALIQLPQQSEHTEAQVIAYQKILI